MSELREFVEKYMAGITAMPNFYFKALDSIALNNISYGGSPGIYSVNSLINGYNGLHGIMARYRLDRLELEMLVQPIIEESIIELVNTGKLRKLWLR